MVRLGVICVFAFLTTLLAQPASASQSFVGTISRIGIQRYLWIEGKGTYVISSHAAESRRTLDRLDTGDVIMASGQLYESPGNRVAIVETVDFVGLRKIIGIWNAVDARGLLQFKNYSELKVYTLTASASLANSTAPLPYAKNFKYTVSPAVGDDWVLFLSDDKTTQMGFLKVTEADAVITMMNSQTGDISQVLRLQKVGRQKAD